MYKPNDFQPDLPLTEAEAELIRSLPKATVALIDTTVLSQASANWRKVAMVVAQTMMDLEARVGPLPDVYFAQRVRHLVETGQLESQGDLARMRYSEVRLVKM